MKLNYQLIIFVALITICLVISIFNLFTVPDMVVENNTFNLNSTVNVYVYRELFPNGSLGEPFIKGEDGNVIVKLGEVSG